MLNKYLGIIPARGGSKGIPRKNLVQIGGKPLLQYTFEAASYSKRLSDIIFTSDDIEMIDFPKNFNKIRAPFIRPKYLASDTASSIDVINHVLDNISYTPYAIVLLQPTSPFRTAEDIDIAIQAFEDSKSHSLIGVTEVLQHPCEMVSIANNKIKWAVKPLKSNRQSFPPYYFISGAIYITKTSFFRKSKILYNNKSYLYNMSKISGIDIDDYFQLKLARCLINNKES